MLTNLCCNFTFCVLVDDNASFFSPGYIIYISRLLNANYFPFFCIEGMEKKTKQKKTIIYHQIVEERKVRRTLEEKKRQKPIYIYIYSFNFTHSDHTQYRVKKVKEC